MSEFIPPTRINNQSAHTKNPVPSMSTLRKRKATKTRDSQKRSLSYLADILWKEITTFLNFCSLFNTFRTAEQGPHSSRLCSCRPQNEGSTFVVLEKTLPNWNRCQNQLPSHEGRELHHFLLRCFDVQISKNTMASQRNISFWSTGYILFMDYDSERKVDDWDDGWVLDSE